MKQTAYPRWAAATGEAAGEARLPDFAGVVWWHRGSGASAGAAQGDGHSKLAGLGASGCGSGRRAGCGGGGAGVLGPSAAREDPAAGAGWGGGTSSAGQADAIHVLAD